MMDNISESGYGRKGVLIGVITAQHLDKVRVEADGVYHIKKGDSLGIEIPGFDLPFDHIVSEDEDAILFLHHNAYVNTGLNNALDLEWGLGGVAIGWIGVDNNSTAVTAATTFLHGAGAGSATTTIILAISPAATRTAQTTTGGATFVNGSFTSGVFVINKIGLLATSTDAGTRLVDVIGGTGGAVGPPNYSRTFVLDLTGAGTFSATLQVAVTASAL